MDKQTIVKIAESINQKRRKEIFDIYLSDDIKSWIENAQREGYFSKRTGKAGWRKIASIPVEVDTFLTRVYGEGYYKDKNFLKKMCKEWLVVDQTTIQ
jgi:hypothetical protein